MKFGALVRIVVLSATLCGWRGAVAAEIVYDNSTQYLGSDYETTDEYGDEVILGGTARVLTEIQIEYYAEFVRNGDELLRLRFYENTGPFWMGNPDYPIPAAPPLYEDSFQISTGFQVIVITLPNIRVPNHFTWTVQFLGISQASVNDRAGLLYFDPPAVGHSPGDDFWELLPDGWAALGRDDLIDNFGARILAIEGLSPPKLTITKSGSNVVISWPTTTGYVLEAAAELATNAWGLVNQTPVISGANSQVTLPAGTGNRYFRLRSSS
jgi:hypothetical protein